MGLQFAKLGCAKEPEEDWWWHSGWNGSLLNLPSSFCWDLKINKYSLLEKIKRKGWLSENWKLPGLQKLKKSIKNGLCMRTCFISNFCKKIYIPKIKYIENQDLISSTCPSTWEASGPTNSVDPTIGRCFSPTPPSWTSLTMWKKNSFQKLPSQMRNLNNFPQMSR